MTRFPKRGVVRAWPGSNSRRCEFRPFAHLVLSVGHRASWSRARGRTSRMQMAREYVDLVGSWGPAILGHAHPAVIESVTHAAAHGLSFGAPSPGEVLLAEEIVSRVDAVEKVRLVSSGTEATMSAIRLARGFTGRAKIIKFAGCYHGHGDSLLAAAGSGVATFALPDSPEFLPQRPETPSSCRTTTSKRCRRHSAIPDRRLPR